MVIFVYVWQAIIDTGYCNMTLVEYIRQDGMGSLQRQMFLGMKSEQVITYTTAVELSFGAVQLVGMTELYLKLNAIYAQVSISYVFKLRKIFYGMILVFACASFVSAYYNSRKGFQLYQGIVWVDIAEPNYQEWL